MLQRIQSIFLLLAGAASLGVFGLDFAKTDKKIPESMIFADAAFNVQDQLALIGLFALAGALALISIFLYKNRRLQMRLTILAFIANLIGVAFGVLFFMQNSSEANSEAIHDGPGIYLPAIAMVLTLVAYRFINKDEKIVRSMDRLR